MRTVARARAVQVVSLDGERAMTFAGMMRAQSRILARAEEQQRHDLAPPGGKMERALRRDAEQAMVAAGMALRRRRISARVGELGPGDHRDQAMTTVPALALLEERAHLRTTCFHLPARSQACDEAQTLTETPVKEAPAEAARVAPKLAPVPVASCGGSAC